MDGGIYDNQGIDAIQLSEARNNKLHDLVIISDVSSAEMKDFKFHPDSPINGLRAKNVKGVIKSLKRVTLGMSIVFVLLTIGAISLMLWNNFNNSIGTGMGIALLSVALVLATLFIFARLYVKSIFNKLGKFLKKQIPDFYYQHLSALDLTDYKIGDYEPLIMDRIKSLLMLLQDVFLKQIRRLNYGKIYNSEDYTGRRISNLSKELTEENFNLRTKKFQSLPNCPDFLKKAYPDILGNELAGIITEAASFGTNLWFTEDDELNKMLDKLIISGQFNMCFNLIVYILELQADEDYNQYDEPIKEGIDDLLSKLFEDWHMFVNDPKFLLNHTTSRS